METRELIIVPNENKNNISLYRCKLKKNETHNEAAKKFIEKFSKKLNLTIEEASIIKGRGYESYIELAKIGNLIIQKDEYTIIYIPPEITYKQYKFLNELKYSLESSTNEIYAISIIKKEGVFYKNAFENKMIEYENKKINKLFKELKSKYTETKNSYVLIIPDEQELTIENGMFYQEFDSNLLDGHGKIFETFCMLNQVSLDFKSSHAGGYCWGEKLLYKNMLSVIKEDDDIYLFIPAKLSKNQLNWLENEKEYLRNFKILEADIVNNQNDIEQYYLEMDPDNIASMDQLLDRIYNVIEEKKESVKDESKQRIKSK